MAAASLEVTLSVAVSENGDVRVCNAERNILKIKLTHDKFMSELRADKLLWSVKTVRVQVPVPLSYEDLSQQ